MKFQVLNNEKLQFFNDTGELTGEIFLSASGDMLITPTSASGDLILGNNDVVGSVEIGNVNIPSTLNLLGGGTITSNGNTLTIGDVAAGDSVIVNGPITASNILSASYALTASHALNAGSGGGGSGIFEATGSIFATTNVLEVTGSMTLINTASNSTSSNTLSIEGSGSVSGSGIFDVRGSAGQLFEVVDGLDGVLMSVNDISGIPILTVSSSGNVILAEGSTLIGTASFASTSPAGAPFPHTGTARIDGNLDVTGSGDDIFKVRSQSGSLFSVDDGLDGILMSVNDISGLPLFEISSSGDVELIEGNISASAASTASFGKIIGNGNAQISGSLTFGGTAPIDLYTGGPKRAIDTSAVGGIKAKGALFLQASADSSYNSRILFGTTNSYMSFGRRGDNSTAIRGVTQNYAFQLFGITQGLIGSTYTTNLPNTTFADNLTISGSGTYMSEPLKVHGSGSSVFEVIGTEGTLFAIDDSLSGSLFAVTNKTGIPRFEVFSDGKIEKQGNNIQDESFTWFMA